MTLEVLHSILCVSGHDTHLFNYLLFIETQTPDIKVPLSQNVNAF